MVHCVLSTYSNLHVTNQPSTANSAFHPFGVGWEGKGRYMVHSVSG